MQPTFLSKVSGVKRFKPAWDSSNFQPVAKEAPNIILNAGKSDDVYTDNAANCEVSNGSMHEAQEPQLVTQVERLSSLFLLIKLCSLY